MTPFLVGGFFILLLFAYLIWRVYVAVKHLDQIPWQFPVLVYLVLQLPISQLWGLLSGAMHMDPGGKAVLVVNVLLTLAATVAVVLPLNRRYDVWREKERERRERERKQANQDITAP